MALSNPWKESDTSRSWLGHLLRAVQPTSLPACGLLLTFLRDLSWRPEVTRDKLGSVCLCQTLLFCVRWYSASPCPSCDSSYPCGQILSSQGYLMAALAWEGAYQNIVIYVYEFVVQHNGSKHLCRRALSSGWQGCDLNHCQLSVFKKRKAGNSSWHFLQSMCEETESLLLSCISFCSFWDLINKIVLKAEGMLFLHLIHLTGFP